MYGAKAGLFTAKNGVFRRVADGAGAKTAKNAPSSGRLPPENAENKPRFQTACDGFGELASPERTSFFRRGAFADESPPPTFAEQSAKVAGRKKEKSRLFFCRGKRPSYIAREAPPRIANYAETTPFVILLFRRGRAINVSRRGANPARPRARKGVGPRRDT